MFTCPTGRDTPNNLRPILERLPSILRGLPARKSLKDHTRVFADFQIRHRILIRSRPGRGSRK